MNKLSIEDKESLYQIDRDGFNALYKALNMCAESQAEALLRADSRQMSDRDISLLKAKHEGALKLIYDFSALFAKTKSTAESK